MTQLTDYQKDIFKEIGNVGIGNGSTALAQMINRDVQINFPTMQVIDIQELFKLQGEHIISNCFITGDLDGCILSIFDKKNGMELIDLMFMQEKGTFKEINDDAKSAYNEMLNVVGGCYLNALADMLNIKLMPKPPIFTFGDTVAIKDPIMHQLSDVKESFLIQAGLIIDGEEVKGNIILVLTEDSNKKVLEIIDEMNQN
jgi:chemotaxis protein CheC